MAATAAAYPSRGLACVDRRAQLVEPDSTLSLYREALGLRRKLAALGAGSMQWLETPDHPALLAFRRDPGFVCTVNLGDRPVTIESPGELLLDSAALDGVLCHGSLVTLPPDTAAWWLTG